MDTFNAAFVFSISVHVRSFFVRIFDARPLRVFTLLYSLTGNRGLRSAFYSSRLPECIDCCRNPDSLRNVLLFPLFYRTHSNS